MRFYGPSRLPTSDPALDRLLGFVILRAVRRLFSAFVHTAPSGSYASRPPAMSAKSLETRPDFMVTLGLRPPYTEEDVKQAYLVKAKAAHPDHGGSIDEFVKLQEAYERGTEYIRFRGSRMNWLAGQIDRYTRQQEMIDTLKSFGGRVDVEGIDWLEKSIGIDFAQVTERLSAIHLPGLLRPQWTEALRLVGRHAEMFAHVRLLDLSGSEVHDDDLYTLSALTALKRLDLSRTSVSGRIQPHLLRLKYLQWLNLAGTRVGWFARWRLRRALPQLTIVV